MRITNSIMLNTQKSNINNNKITMDILQTQMSTQKKISKPSDDPIIAVRSLRLRANVTELTQYVDKNIQDAQSWIEVTETAMNNMRDILKDMYYNFSEGDNDYLATSERLAILEDLEALVDEFYEEGNSSYAGRTVFTGYKTNSNFTFKSADTQANFNIDETFTLSQLGVRDYVSNNLTIDKADLQEIPQVNFPQTSEVTFFNLTYSGMDEINSLTYVNESGNTISVPITTYQLTSGDDAAYLNPPADGVNYIKETGELIFGETLEHTLSNLGSDTVITVNYDKQGFQPGEVNPVMYFDCVDNTDPDNPIVYTKEQQDIEYNVGFNQKLKVNTEASEVLLLDVRKEIGNLRDAVTAVEEAEKKKADIEAMLEDSRYTENEKEALTTMLSAVEKEIDLKKDRMVGLFKQGVGSMQEYEAHVNMQIADLGNRYSQLTMINSRMQQQKTNFQELLTQNEDRELSDIMLDYTASGYAYQLSLQATGNISKLSLLNYI